MFYLLSILKYELLIPLLGNNIDIDEYNRIINEHCIYIEDYARHHIILSTKYMKEYIKHEDTIMLLYALINMCPPEIIKKIKIYTDPDLYNKQEVEDIIKWNYIKYIAFIDYAYFHQSSYEYISTGKASEYIIKEELRNINIRNLKHYCTIFDIKIPYYLNIQLDDKVDDIFNDTTVNIVKDILNQYGV